MVKDHKNANVNFVIFVPTLGIQLDRFENHYAPLLDKYGGIFEPVVAPFIDISRQRICQLAAERGYPRAYMLDDDVLLPETEFVHFLEASLPVDFFAYPFKGNRNKVTAGFMSHPDLPMHTFPSLDLFADIPSQSYLYADWCGAGAMSIRADYLATGLFFELTKISSPFSSSHVVRYGEDVSYCMHMRMHAPSIFWEEYERRVTSIAADYQRHSRKFLVHYSPNIEHLDRFQLGGCSKLLNNRS